MSVQLFPNGAGTLLETFQSSTNTQNFGTGSLAERQIVSVADGGKATYSATYYGQSAGTGATTALAYLAGSASKLVKLVQITISATIATAGEEYDLLFQKETVLPTGGTKATAATIVPNDSSDGAATAVTAFYTAAGTDGTVTGVFQSAKVSLYIATATTVQPPTVPYVFNFGQLPGAKAPTLRGAAQAIVLTLNGATPAHASSWDVTFVWTEE